MGETVTGRLLAAAVLLALGAAAGGGAVAATSSPPLPKRVASLERRVAVQSRRLDALEAELAATQERQQVASEANDRQQGELDAAVAGLACLASWTAPKPTDDLGACYLLNLKPYAPDYFALIVALAKAAGH